jgi:hypothetical protein
MDEKEWLIWQDANERLLLMFRAASPCRDCTPLFHEDMLEGGMCDGLPLTEGQREPSLKYSTYDELKAVRRTYPKYGAPSGLSEALYRARMREYRRRKRAGMAV